MILKTLIIPIVLFLLFTKIQGQPTLPNVIPPSPNASALTKSFDYPVSNSTGIPEISIPLYTISCGQLNLPISISYHSSGRKVDDITGPIGLGWSLNAGGMISRIIYGDADDDYFKYPNPWRKADDLRVSRDYIFLAAIDNRWKGGDYCCYDTQYDVFTYIANGLSGNFILKDVNNTKVPTLIPKKPYLIEWNKTSNYFNIVDDNGIIYRFGVNISNNKSYHEWVNHTTGEPGNHIAGWMLAEIISANKEDTIHFKYQSFNGVRKSYSTVYYKKTDGNSLNEISGREETSEEKYNTERLTEIDYRSGKVIFNLQSQAVYPSDLVESIEIKSNDNKTIKKIKFIQSTLNRMSDGIMPTYKLDKIVFEDKLEQPIESYSLDYYPTADEINVRYCDFWGYYNASGKLDMCPFKPTYLNNEGIVNPDANRNTNFEAMKSGVLKKITYPTGGSTEFIYQANQYYDQGEIKPCGGLRIYQIKSTENNKTLLKTYKYGINECGYGFLPFVPSYLTMSYTTAIWELHGESDISCYKCYNQIQFFSNILPIFGYVASKPVVYSNVTEYQGDESNNTGKIVYTYDGDDRTPYDLQVYGSGNVNYRLWAKSDLTSKSIYTKTNDLSHRYKLIKTVSYNYTETEYSSEAIQGLMLWRKYIMTPESAMCPSGAIGEWCRQGRCFPEEYYAQSGGESLQIYGFGDYSYVVGKKELTNIIETEQTNNGIFSSNTTNVFDTNHLLKAQNTLDSKGNTLKKEFLHPVDFSGTPYSEMITRNMVNSVIQVDEYSDSTFLHSTKTNYGYFQNNAIIAPSLVEMKKGTNDYEPRLAYHDYDSRGNILSVSNTNNTKVTYLWGYNQAYPVAKIENANYTTLSSNSDFMSYINQLQNYTALTSAIIRNNLKILNHNIRNKIPTSGALITTYTYSPLIGMTSQTDPNGVTTYYEYDAFGRLMLIKDDDGNIIKTYDYHYKE